MSLFGVTPKAAHPRGPWSPHFIRLLPTSMTRMWLIEKRARNSRPRAASGAPQRDLAGEEARAARAVGQHQRAARVDTGHLAGRLSRRRAGAASPPCPGMRGGAAIRRRTARSPRARNARAPRRAPPRARRTVGCGRRASPSGRAMVARSVTGTGMSLRTAGGSRTLSPTPTTVVDGPSASPFTRSGCRRP